MTRLLRGLAIAGILAVAFASSVAARPTPPPSDPPVASVQVDSICQERTPTPGAGFGWYAVGAGFDGCNRAYQTINFDGVTGHDFCLGGFGDQVLYQAPANGCAPFAVPVTLTGDGSVSVCLSVHDRVEAPWSATCDRDASI